MSNTVRSGGGQLKATKRKWVSLGTWTPITKLFDPLYAGERSNRHGNEKEENGLSCCGSTRTGRDGGANVRSTGPLPPFQAW